MTVLAERVAAILQENGFIREEDKELYIYGLQQGKSMILNVLTTIAIGIIFGQVWACILFMCAYFPLRSCAGGYHARTPLRCYLFSIMMVIAALAFMRLPVWNNVISSILVIVSSIVIMFLAPVEDSNKPLDAKEIIVFKKRSRVILCVLVGMILIFRVMGLLEISICIMIALIMLSIMLILGKLKNLSNQIWKTQK